MTIDELIARESIRHLLAKYNNSGDRGVIDEMVSCFANDSTLVVNDQHIDGKNNIANYFTEILNSGYMAGENQAAAKHHLTTSRIEFSDEKNAQVWTYYLLVQAGTIVQNGLYIDRFKYIDKHWLISYRRVKVECDTLPSP